MGFLGPHKYVPRCIECGYHQTEEMGEKGNKSHFCKHPEMPGKKRSKGVRIIGLDKRSPKSCPLREKMLEEVEKSIWGINKPSN